MDRNQIRDNDYPIAAFIRNRGRERQQQGGGSNQWANMVQAQREEIPIQNLEAEDQDTQLNRILRTYIAMREDNIRRNEFIEQMSLYRMIGQAVQQQAEISIAQEMIEERDNNIRFAQLLSRYLNGEAVDEGQNNQQFSEADKAAGGNARGR